MSKEKVIYEASVFSRCRITIPKVIRDELGLSAGDQIVFTEDGHSFKITKLESIVGENTDADIDNAIKSSEEELHSVNTLIESRDALKELRYKHFPSSEISTDTLKVMDHPCKT